MKIHVVKIILTLASVLILSACTNRQLYEATQQNRIQACNKELPQDQAECRARYEMSYDEYEKERQAILKDDGNDKR